MCRQQAINRGLTYLLHISSSPTVAWPLPAPFQHYTLMHCGLALEARSSQNKSDAPPQQVQKVTPQLLSSPSKSPQHRDKSRQGM